MTFNRIVRTAPAIDLPVSMEEVRRHLVIDDTTQDDYLTSLIEAACDMIDGPHGIGIALGVQSFAMRLEALHSCFTIPIYPVRSIVSVEWLDHDLTQRTTANFRLDNISNPARVYLTASGSPLAGTVVVNFVAGHDEIPTDLRIAILMLVGHLYEHREATTEAKLEETPFAVNSILNRYRVG